MNLTDEQWRLIEPILPSPSPSGRGRPPLDRRAVLDGILWKFRTDNPWYDMPPDYPSYQTCYRYHRKWARDGVMKKIYTALFSDVLCLRPLIEKVKRNDPSIRIVFEGSRFCQISQSGA